MILSYAVAILAYLTTAYSREVMRPFPTISNSLVNLGKMEISFYFNGTNHDVPANPANRFLRGNNLYPYPKHEVITEAPCPCQAGLRNPKETTSLNNPAGLLNKLLMSNDLFSTNKDPFISSLCCDSHEHIQEGSFIFEFPTIPSNSKPAIRNNPTHNKPKSGLNNVLSMPMMPFIFDTIVPSKSMMNPLKAKSIEIFLFPQKKKNGFEMQQNSPIKRKELKDLTSKDDIQVVGGKELKNNIEFFKPVFPVVKKDLNQQERNAKLKAKENAYTVETGTTERVSSPDKDYTTKKEDTEKEVKADQIIIEPGNKPNAL